MAVVADAACWLVALSSVLALRPDLVVSRWWPVTLLLPTVLVHVAVGWASRLYVGYAQVASFEEARPLAITVLAAGAALSVADAVGDLVPPSVVVATTSLALLAMASVRLLWRWQVESDLRPDPGTGVRTVVFGAGSGGTEVIAALMRNPSSPYLPVAVLDDDQRKQRRVIKGISVVGGRADLAATAERFDATALLIAIPAARADLVRDLTAAAHAAGLEVRVLPTVAELLDRPLRIDHIRRVTERDLLSRREVSIDLAAAARYLSGKRVLVTGAGGSIGSELCRQVHGFAPAELIMLDRDESALHAVQLSIEGRALLDRPNLVVADIRDRARMFEVFEEWRPHVVFHAAALKHLSLLELHPAEAYKTNVWGTQHVLEAARATGVERFVNISTDKAASPASMLGYSKRVAERLTAAMARRTPDATYLSVRFGNVLGSRGSVLTAFRSQIEAGGPVTVTDPDVRRYFMTVGEAVQLVLEAGAVGRSCEVLILDMGDPVRIDDVARRLIEESGRPIEVVYTGLRKGEKLDEVLLGADEVGVTRSSPLICHVPVPPLEPSLLPPIDGSRLEQPARLLVDLASAGRRGVDGPTTTGLQPA